MALTVPFGLLTSSSASATTLTGSITVSAASSLTGAFTQLGASFQRAHHGTKINFNFASSSTLALQIQQGAPADVFASASVKDMGEVQHSHDIAGAVAIFTRNTLAIVVRPGNPLGIHTLADLTRARVVALCVVSAPCGAAAREALLKSKVLLRVSRISLGQDVKSTLAEVTTGDADAAIVYVTDAKTIGRQGASVSIPPAKNVITKYPIGLVKASTNRALAQAWIEYVLSPTGQRALRAAGFLAAP